MNSSLLSLKVHISRKLKLEIKGRHSETTCLNHKNKQRFLNSTWIRFVWFVEAVKWDKEIQTQLQAVRGWHAANRCWAEAQVRSGGSGEECWNTLHYLMRPSSRFCVLQGSVDRRQSEPVALEDALNTNKRWKPADFSIFLKTEKERRKGGREEGKGRGPVRWKHCKFQRQS